MMKPDRNRGTVLMMVVGLLTIIGMLGTTFLVITRLDARQSATIEAKSQIRPLAAGVGAGVGAALRDKLKMGSNGPYSSYEEAARKRWGEYSQSPSKGSADWLSGDGHPSSIVDEGTMLDDATRDAMNDPGARTPVDWNDDGKPDAYLFDTKVMNTEGKKYWAEIRVVDASGRVCVNVAGSKLEADLTETDMISPSNIELKDFLGAVGWLGDGEDPGLHLARCGQDVGAEEVKIQKFYEDMGSRLLKPASDSYRPFTVGDEVGLNGGGAGGLVEAGRLHKILKKAGGEAYSNRGELTTYSVSRALMRYPTTDLKQKLLVSTETSRSELWEQAYYGMKGVNWLNDAEQRLMAGHFVANLWAYQSSGTTDSPWEFNVPGTSYTVYGLVQDLVITEAYARHIRASAVDADDWAWGYAIELMNPTKGPDPIDLSGYRVEKLGGSSVSLPSASIAANGGKVVLYSFGAGDGRTASSFFGGTFGPEWHNVSSVDFSGSGTQAIYLVKALADGVPIDEILSTEVAGYSCPNKTSPVGSLEKDARRDDTMTNRARYNIGAYKPGSSHALGSPNGVGDGDLNATAKGAKYSAPIIRGGKDGTGGKLRSIGELGRIYLQGPFRVGTAMRAFPYVMTHGPSGIGSKNMFDTSYTGAPGRLDYCPIKVSDQHGWGVGGDDYPDIPVAWEEWFRGLAGDGEGDDLRRFYGLINVNTASLVALKLLPYPETITVAGASYDVDPAAVAQEIIDYRDMKGSYSTRASGASMTYLRDAAESKNKGFFAASEVAIPLARYAEKLMVASRDDPRRKGTDFIDGRDAIYRAIANCITVQSDVFIVQIRILLDNPPEYTWQFVEIVDRSGCEKASDRPVVRLFTEVQ